MSVASPLVKPICTSAPALVVLLTLLGAALRFWNLGGQSLWLDEVFTARVAPLSFAEIIRTIRLDLDTPPLHPFLVHVFLVLGQSEFVLRLPSALASVLAIPLMYVVGRRLAGQSTGLVAAALLAFSPFAVYYAQEARMYALMLFFALLAFYCLLRALDSGGCWWLSFVVASVLGLYNHFFGFLVLGLLVFYALVHLVAARQAGQRDRARRDALRVGGALAAIVMLYLPWLPVLFNFIGENYAAVPYGQGWQANLGPRVALNIATLMLSGYWSTLVTRWATGVLFVLGLLILLHRRPQAGLFVAVSVTAPFALIGVLNPGHFVTERYFIFMLPMFTLGMAAGLVALAGAAQVILAHGLSLLPMTTRRRGAALPRSAAILAVVVAVHLIGAHDLHHYFQQPPKPAWRQVARYVAGTVPPGGLIVVATFPHWDKEPLQHYLQVGGRRIVYASEEPRLRHILAEERAHPWWIVYAGSERRLGRVVSAALDSNMTVVSFDFLAVIHRQGGEPSALEDGKRILTALKPRIPRPYQGEVERVLAGITTISGDPGRPIPPPVPTTVR